MIIGRDMMEFLGIDIKFSDHTIVWDGRTIPFRDADDTSASLCVDEPVQVTEAQDRLKKILDAKYEAADLDEIVDSQDQLSPQEKQQLLQLLTRYKHLFDGTLGKWTGSKVSLDLVDGAEP